tara:strand:+ start:11030 stop:11359 length:330 start_codon:yes stop_codon:yes gene_type:complete
MKTVQQSIRILESFLHNEYGVEVYYGKDGDNAFFADAGIVEINTSSPEEEQYHTLLHEASHAVLYPDTSESAAWSMAESMAESLDLTPLSGAFFKLREDCLREYREASS